MSETEAPSGLRIWVLGSRPRTLVAAVCPVLVGTALAWNLSAARSGHHHLYWWRALGALAVGVFVQIGTNYVNDYADGKRGTDAVRVGPIRLVASGLASARAVRRAAIISFALAAIVGLALAAVTSWWLLALGAACFLAGYFYTGGPKPYGYLGLGEVFVFVFFGLVATVFTTFVQFNAVEGQSFIAASALGLLACALLQANNVRDRANDEVAGKKTLAVRLGDSRARQLFVASVLGGYVAIAVLSLWHPWVDIAFVTLYLARQPIQAVRSGASGRDLIAVLQATSQLELAVAVLVAVGLVI